ncbi:MAG: hypothetical protein WBA31_06195 [Candidatus Dormiibacterota bacterium]
MIFVGSLSAYLAAAYYLVFRLNYVAPDALSRVANAFYVLYSRDPHLAAIGMIWNPLPSFLELPLVALKSWLPWLVDRGFAGNVETACFGAGAATVVAVLLRDAGVGRALRIGLVAVWALNPMVLLYSSNGMSDITLMFFLLAAGWLLLRWLRNPRDILLVGLGAMVAAATLVRYEAIPFAGLVALVVVVREHRAGSNWRELEARLLLYGLPVLLAILFWVGANAVIMHNPLYFLNGSYANLSQTQSTHAGQLAALRLETWPAAVRFVATESVQLFPAYPALVILTLLLSVWRRQALLGIGLALMSTAALMMMAYLIHRGGLALYLRYFVSVIPFSFVLAAYCLSLVRHRLRERALAGVLLLAFAASGAASYLAMANPGLGVEEHAAVAAARQNRPLQSSPILQELRLGRVINRLDRAHHLVLIDTFEGGPLVLGSPDPRLFVVTSDLDFEAALNDPQAYRVAYFVVPEPIGDGKLDAINRRYPGLWEDGDGFATQVAQLGSGVQWRLYRIVGPAPQ